MPVVGVVEAVVVADEEVSTCSCSADSVHKMMINNSRLVLLCHMNCKMLRSIL